MLSFQKIVPLSELNVNSKKMKIVSYNDQPITSSLSFIQEEASKEDATKMITMTTTTMPFDEEDASKTSTSPIGIGLGYKFGIPAPLMIVTTDTGVSTSSTSSNEPISQTLMNSLGSLIHQKWTNCKRLGRGAYGTVNLIQTLSKETPTTSTKKSSIFESDSIDSVEDFDELNLLKENGLEIIHTIDGFVGIKNKVEEYAMKKVHCMNKQSIRSILQEPAIHRRISLCSDRVPKFFKMIEIDEENKTASWAVEKMKGSLKDLIQEDGVKDYDDVRNCILGCLRSVSDVHQFGEVAHMDIKPDNFMANSFVDIKLSDFGSTTTKPFIDGTSMIVPEMFTLYTTSPECVKATCSKEHIEIDGEKSDAWSIGCSIIYVLTGKPTFSYLKNSPAIMITLMENTKPKIPEGLPEDINEFLEDCLKLIDEGRKTPTELLEKYEAMFNNMPKDCLKNSISE